MATVVTNTGLMIINEIQKYVTHSNHDVLISRGHINTYLGHLMKSNTIGGYSTMVVQQSVSGAGEIRVDFTININDPTTSMIFRVPEPKKSNGTQYVSVPKVRGAKTKKINSSPKSTEDPDDAYQRAMSIF